MSKDQYGALSFGEVKDMHFKIMVEKSDHASLFRYLFGIQYNSKSNHNIPLSEAFPIPSDMIMRDETMSKIEGAKEVVKFLAARRKKTDKKTSDSKTDKKE